MPRNDLYKILGVNKSADKKSIKKAYHRAAKKAHPDTGGSEKEFALIKKCFDILSDNDRRARYDSTGDDSENSPDNKHGDAINVIAFAFNTVLAKCAQNADSPLEIDIISRVNNEINNSVRETEKQIRISRGMLEIDLKLSGRFSSDENNIFDNIVGHRISQLRTNIANMEKSLENCKQAKDLIKECKFCADEKPYESRGDEMMRKMGCVSYV